MGSESIIIHGIGVGDDFVTTSRYERAPPHGREPAIKY